MPTTTEYTCSKCGIGGSTFSTWGSHSYLADNELIRINRRAALCNTCDSVVTAEVLPTEENIKRLKKIDKKPAINNDWYIEEEEKRLKVLRNRESPARCLKCGSHDFDFIPDVEYDRERERSQTPIRTGLIHKNCGGKIYANPFTPNFFMGDNLPKRVFDVEGNEIE
jgi:hypothetical protein